MHFPPHRVLDDLRVIGYRAIGSDDLAEVVVDAEQVDRLADDVEVAVEHFAVVPAVVLGGLGRVAATEERVDIPTVVGVVDNRCSSLVFG